MRTTRSGERLQESARQVEALLERHRMLEQLAQRQEGPKKDLLEALSHRQNLAELAARLRALHPADLALILESLPAEDRRLVWTQLQPRQAAQVLAEVSELVRAFVLGCSDVDALRAVVREMDRDDLAWLADSLPPGLREEVYHSLSEQDRSWIASQAIWPEGSVGHLMTGETLTVREDESVGGAAAELRAHKTLPHQADALFVVDSRNVLRGVLPLRELLLHAPETGIGEVMNADPVVLEPHEPAHEASQAFERYGLVAAPVVDDRGKLLGRVSVDAVVDFIRRQAELAALKRAGLSGEEDLFAPARESARNRWVWLSVNLVTAFVASRVIGLFEETIQGLVALATLMPIVASVGGNTGNQTVALMIRGLALDQVTRGNIRHLVRKELSVALLNGVVFGSVVGLAASLLYGSYALGVVMATAVLLNLLVASVVAVGVPIVLHRSGRDPAQGASVLLTFTTDGMGFFIFLGLARAFLL